MLCQGFFLNCLFMGLFAQKLGSYSWKQIALFLLLPQILISYLSGIWRSFALIWCSAVFPGYLIASVSFFVHNRHLISGDCTRWKLPPYLYLLYGVFCLNRYFGSIPMGWTIILQVCCVITIYVMLISWWRHFQSGYGFGIGNELISLGRDPVLSIFILLSILFVVGYVGCFLLTGYRDSSYRKQLLSQVKSASGLLTGIIIEQLAEIRAGYWRTIRPDTGRN